MKKTLAIILLILFTYLVNFNFVNAETAAIQKINISIGDIDNSEDSIIEEVENTEELTEEELEITREYIFIFFSEFFKDTPESYKYINLNFKNIKEGSSLDHSLKILVYHNKIENEEIYLMQNKTINAYAYYRLAEEILGFEFTLDKESLEARLVEDKDLHYIETSYANKLRREEKALEEETISDSVLGDKEAIFNDVYESLVNSHYDKEELDSDDLIYGALQGLAESTGDKHTVYFPPVESENFTNSLQGEYEGIGSYVEMTEPGKVVITSPIPGGPAEKAGVKGGDIVIKVDENEVTEDNSLKEVTSWIKGEAGTTVNLTIIRGSKEIEIEVTREKISLKNIEYERLGTKTYYIQLKSFGSGISGEFKEALEDISEHPTVNKIIIDLRNNGGGFLNEVTEMLSYVVDKGEPTAVVKYNGNEKSYYSNGYDLIDFSKYEIVILQNSGTASASEIMIGTMQDYLENITTIGENTYGKGSVQTIKRYVDGSSFKYTIAKWFTGKTQTGIDGIGIAPDIELELDIELYQESGKDNQLEKAIKH